MKDKREVVEEIIDICLEPLGLKKDAYEKLQPAQKMLLVNDVVKILEENKTSFVVDEIVMHEIYNDGYIKGYEAHRASVRGGF